MRRPPAPLPFVQTRSTQKGFVHPSTPLSMRTRSHRWYRASHCHSNLWVYAGLYPLGICPGASGGVQGWIPKCGPFKVISERSNKKTEFIIALRGRPVLFSVALLLSAEFCTVKLEWVYRNQERKVLCATITCPCLCICVLVCVYLHIYRCIHIYECVCMCVLYFSFAWACGGTSVVWFGLVFSLMHSTVVNSWSNLRSNCRLSRKSRRKVRLAAPLVDLGPDPPREENRAGLGLARDRRGPELLGSANPGESAPATWWKPPKSKLRVSFFGWDPLILCSLWGTYYLGLRLETGGWERWNEYVKTKDSETEREREGENKGQCHASHPGMLSFKGPNVFISSFSCEKKTGTRSCIAPFFKKRNILSQWKDVFLPVNKCQQLIWTFQ